MASLCEDVAREILLRLPLKPVLRFRSVCKFWRDTIDSTPFKQSHIHYHANNDKNNNNDNEEDDTLVVAERIKGLSYPYSISFWLCRIPEMSEHRPEPDRLVAGPGCIVGPVNGLFCIYSINSGENIEVCNPSLGLIKKLPLDRYPDCGSPHFRPNVAIGYDNIARDYKVLQFLSPTTRCGRVHVLIYSKTTNSWRELAHQDCGFFVPDNFYIEEPIKSSCTDGATAHWFAGQGFEGYLRDLIVSFDMKNEVFRILEIDFVNESTFARNGIIYAKRDTFVLFNYFLNQELLIFEARIEGNILHWDFVTKHNMLSPVVVPPSLWMNDFVVLKRLCGNDCVALYHRRPYHEVIFYDYYRNEVVRRFSLPNNFEAFHLLKYEGSFITP